MYFIFTIHIFHKIDNTSLYSAGWVKVRVHKGITIVIILRFFRLCDINKK
jgi:hypothetical protein